MKIADLSREDLVRCLRLTAATAKAAVTELGIPEGNSDSLAYKLEDGRWIVLEDL